MAADLASDLSGSGGEVTAKLNTDQWVVVRYINSKSVLPLSTLVLFYFMGFLGEGCRGSHCHCSAQPEKFKPDGGDSDNQLQFLPFLISR